MNKEIIDMKRKNMIIKSMTVALIIFYGADLLYIASNLQAFDTWLKLMPGLSPWHGWIKWLLPLVEVVLIAGLVKGLLLPTYYSALGFQLAKIGYLFWAFTGRVIFQKPYHTLWAEPTWRAYVFSELIVAALIFSGIILLEFVSKKTTIYKKALRKMPVEVH